MVAALRRPRSRVLRYLLVVTACGDALPRCRGHLRGLGASAPANDAEEDAGPSDSSGSHSEDATTPFVGVPEPLTGAWAPLGPNIVATREGDELFSVKGDLDFCKTICTNYQGCRSFAYCAGSACYLKGGEVNASSPQSENTFCTTYYWNVTTVANDAEQIVSTTPEMEVPEVLCRSFTASLDMSSLQHYDGNPESDIHGKAEVFMCTNGTLLATLELQGVESEIIATHIHHCHPSKHTGELCSGAPVVNFCGSNLDGLIDDGAPYARPCEGHSPTGVFRITNVAGTLVPTLGLTVQALVMDMIESPGTFYFNVHTFASFNQWNPDFVGVARGVMDLEVLPVTTTTFAPVPAVDTDKCFKLYSRLAMSQLQSYAHNADSHASGYASLTLCTNGTMSATVLVFGGVSEIIATHIYKCEGGDTEETQTAAMCSGQPVIAFCGENGKGYLDVGVPYSQACNKYTARTGVSRTMDINGTVVSHEASDVVAELVMDIVRHPQSYYFNVHSFDSYDQWYPEHRGMCRGPMNVWWE